MEIQQLIYVQNKLLREILQQRMHYSACKIYWMKAEESCILYRFPRILISNNF